MSSNETKFNNFFIYWLALSLTLVFFIIIVGGFTRLTNSGLSIIEWELFRGIIPPLNEETWLNYFDKYKTIPQYSSLNYDMSLNEFKVIFYWEFFHRILARLIGLFFLVPLIFFIIKKNINKNYLKTCILVFLLIMLQGIVGWYMVKSGLVSNISVSHYRLSVHLTIAIIIISIIFWLLKNVILKKEKKFLTFSRENLPYQLFILIIFFQIIIGAFVSGLDAGKIYQTWPLMGNSYIPNDIEIRSIFNLFEFNNHSLVQFYHRNLAYLILLTSIYLTFLIYRDKETRLYRAIKILLSILCAQVLFGIITLIHDLNIYFASVHQIVGVLLVLSALNLYYLKLK